MKKYTNRLIKEKSPYLLQHAHNPVDWYPWCDEAFKKAEDLNRPVFLSIGYSTCHWCHVMEKESFEDEEVAELLNNEMVAIKVDREERPDLDNVYMTVCQMLTRSGGWPLTIIMTPDRVPFFAGTYIPKNTSFGRVGLMELIPRIKDVWENRKNEVVESAKKIHAALKGVDTLAPGQMMDETILDKAFDELETRYDTELGGFGNAPKFPSPHNFLFLLRYWKRTGKEKALEMVENTLSNMRLGGIYDHAGYGFHRYSTDREWLLPHFEKMLYDQSMLAIAFIETYLATGIDQYATTAKEIFSYVLRDMTSPEGGFYSAEDADSEGVEGKFYVWTENELREILGDNSDLFIRVFNVKKQGNFKDESTGIASGENILHLSKSLEQSAMEHNMPLSELEQKLSSAMKTLFGVRKQRVHPYKDDKILTDWNGLMIAAFALGSRAFNNKDYADAGKRAADFILDKMRIRKGGLLHRYRDKEAAIEGNADDYAFFIWGLIEFYEATFDVKYLKHAMELNDYFIKGFCDNDRGGFFFTPNDGEALLVRKREVYDGAVPSANSVAVFNLVKLSRITGRTDLEKIAEKTISAFSEAVKQMPSAHTFLMCGMEFIAGPSCEVVITGKDGNRDTTQMIKTLNKKYYPNKVTVFRPCDKTSGIEMLAEYLKDYKCIDSRATAYVCRNNSCAAPVVTPENMMELIER
ncbi:MAG: thioredoxin domain-containing protein [Deltaproteobacteria bacterium]|nr:thioredoxin domain-containing protein [Deltaproteobacteria bacterium]